MRHSQKKGSTILVDVACALHFPKFVTAQEIDVHVDPPFQWCNLLEKPANTDEGLHIAVTDDGSKSFAKRRKHCNSTPHLIIR